MSQGIAISSSRVQEFASKPRGVTSQALRIVKGVRFLCNSVSSR